MNDIRTLQANSVPPEHSDVEHIKQQSKHLRGTIEEGLFSEESGFGKEDIQLIKFHGIYQQKNRDLPKEQAFHSFMLRGRIPGGRLTAGQYLGWDLLANEYGNGSLRITTRQALQLHGILKGNLQATLQSIHKLSLTTLGACGDVVRNVTQSVNPWGRKDLAQLDDLAQTMSDHFKFTSNSYAELWLNGEKVDWQTEQDPIYKEQYLPRKFKIGVTLAGHNDIDLYTNCLGLAATINENQEIDGAFVFAGGGMGMTHNKPDTFPRAADLLGWVPQEHILTVAQSIVEIHRDWGDRTNRKHSRLKYVLAEKGVEWFKKEVEQRSDVILDNRPLPAWNTQSYLGWHEQVNGKLALGMHILSGRIVDTPAAKLKSALRAILEAYHFNVQLTADQDLILLNIEPNLKGVIEEIFADHDVQFTSPDELRNRALACPALPTCTLGRHRIRTSI
jgi:sulfite reductase beta subunit-like hemoprotein